ncbi:hypothetical protein BKP35_18105 [Anaerobacillus arseniciselenatis]|uniref:DUF1850 domain-containing protein n=1 Tax=Anaerobacillus arseniciselenatis TaxID=85682 RepID=A0A1S2L767_9BACI|nr:DUF1850 domain-containing protein [Anaerobacillus arseniciselenatis]OIJ08174.1 hypothetical protein BKP35_18105 [Anaerobacillus arseniciselenatis]
MSIIAVFVVIIVMMTMNATINTQGQFVIKEQRSTNEYLKTDVTSGDLIEIQWIHSVELTPWMEVYQVSDQFELILIETRFQSFGAGVPELLQGDVVTEGGFTVIKNLKEVIDRFTWIHSHQANFTIRLNGTELIETEELPHHIPMELFIEKR